MPLYVDDYEAATAHLSLLEDGIYTRLLRLMWRTPGCTIPDDDQWVCRKMRITADDERAALMAVIGEFCERKGGRIISPRLVREWKKADETSRKRAEAGKKGGRPKNIDRIEEIEKAGLSREKAGPKHPEPQPEPLVERDKSLSRACASETVESLWKVLPKRKRAGTSKPKLAKVVSRLLKAGKDPAAILTAVSRCYSEARHVEEDGQYAPAVYSWLADGIWENWLPDAEPVETPPDISDDEWRRMLLTWHESRSWPPYAGPNPTQPDCRVPEAVMGRYRTWANEQAKRSAA